MAEYSIDDICNELAELYGSPCNFSPQDEYMLENGKCEDCCGDIPDKECWKRYFDTKFNTDAGEIANCIEFRKRMKR